MTTINVNMTITPETLSLVTLDVFRGAMESNIAERPMIADSVSSLDELPEDATYFLTMDGKSGFGITPSGYWIALHSVVTGRGDYLASQAVSLGARALDCFDGYLPELYARHGFEIVRREANWTEGGPDVVFMLASVSS